MNKFGKGKIDIDMFIRGGVSSQTYICALTAMSLLRIG